MEKRLCRLFEGGIATRMDWTIDHRSSRPIVAQGVFVSFVVTARHGTRDISFQRGSMLSALDQAFSLLNAGMDDVLIHDARGRSHTAAEFSRVLLEAGLKKQTTAESRSRAA